MVLTAAGVGVASPAFALTQVDESTCDTLATSVEPGGCVSFSTIPLLDDPGTPLVYGSSCGGTPVPTLTSSCVEFALDAPI